ncbi:enoyl-CoA hydratase-related protein [Pseudomonas citronellolis]|jgi:enoyl-CoA hydratase/carnithine racemase|uniref:Enoyl-CoA hydratase-related protein n=1 Tax=Pseudomonas citronellolis TaxID=53408 RepID=A0AAW6P6X3_9PSED|nr:enoyl-CoA hydratase-related protein [Pseudomonas citronellolis]MDF3842986.1 enoyl-CoA hydratase-related protein [Pseudomonas citronellolis]
MQDAVLLERHGAVALLTLNLPEKRNALAPALYQRLAELLLRLEDDRQCRAIVITGGKHFCAGGELDGLDSNPQQMRANMREGHRIIRQITCGRLPVVAAVQGAAFGAGLSLASACDFVVASANSQFGAVFGKVGVMADWGLLWTLPQRIGASRCKRLVMLAEVLDGSRAHSIGLVDEMADSDAEILPHALELAQRLASAAPGPLGAVKTLMARAQSLDALLDWEADSQALLIASEDFAEGRDAFFGKRRPEFRGR